MDKGERINRGGLGIGGALRDFLSVARGDRAQGQGAIGRPAISAVAIRWGAQAVGRWRHLNRRTRESSVWILLGLTAWGVFWITQPAPPTSPRLRTLQLARSLKSGEKLVMGDLSLVDAQGPGEVSESLLEAAIEAYAVRDLPRGIRLKHSDLEWAGRLRKRLPEGKRAYPVEIESDVPLVEGDRIDLWPAGSVPQEPMQSVLVLDPKARRQPILALSNTEIRWVEMARQKGKLRAAVRSDRDPPSARRKRPHGPRQSAKVISIWEAG